MSKLSRITPLPTTPALVRRTASIAVVATAVGVVGCTQHVPPQTPPPQTYPQVEPPEVPPQAPQAQPAPQVDEGNKNIVVHD